MTALIVVFITLSLMGSALWIMPSRRERDKMALRMQARSPGITVQLKSIDLPDRWDKVTTRQSVCAYHKFHAKPLKDFADFKLLPYEVWKHANICSGWYANAETAIAPETLELLEKHQGIINGIEVTPNGVSLYWQEKGTIETVDDLNDLIDALFEHR